MQQLHVILEQLAPAEAESMIQYVETAIEAKAAAAAAAASQEQKTKRSKRKKQATVDKATGSQVKKLRNLLVPGIEWQETEDEEMEEGES